MKALPAPVTKRKTRKQYRRIARPVLLFGFLLMLLVFSLTVVLPHPASQISITSDIVLMVMVFCPMALCSALLFVILAACIYAISAAQSGIENGLHQLGQKTTTVAERAASLSAVASEKSIQLNARTAPLDTFWERRAQANKLESGQDQ